MNPSDWITLISAFGGALLGAAIATWTSWRLQTQANALTLARDENSRRTRDLSQATKLIFRESFIASDVAATVRSIHESLERANAAGMTAQGMWSRVEPIFGSMDAQPVNVEELEPFIRGKEFDVVHEYVDLAMQHQVLVEAISEYNERRSALKEILPPSERGSGGKFTGYLTEEQLVRVGPYLAEVESLIQTVKQRAETLVDRANRLILTTSEAGARLFGSDFPCMEIVEKGNSDRSI